MGDRGKRLHRLADRWLGIPAVWLLGGLRGGGRLSAPIGSIGVLATAAIGDTLLLSAVLRDLRAALPDARITLFAGESNHAAALLSCPAQEIIRIPATRPLPALRAIRARGPFDCWIDCGPWPRINALLSHFAPAGYKLGFRSEGQHRHFVYDAPVQHRRDCHEIENLRRLLVPLGVSCGSLPRVDVEPEPADEPYRVLHMFPGGYRSGYKAWARRNWIELIDRLCAQGIRVQLSGAPADAEEALAIRAACASPARVRSRAGELDLRETAALLAGAQLLISVNTGIMHLGAACGVPVVALNGPTNPLRWGPLGERVVNLNSTSPSAGCLHLGFEYDSGDKRSLDTIGVDQVLAAAELLLGRSRVL